METRDYDLFNISGSNRKILKGQVEKIKQSILKIGFLKYNPIVVDSDYNIIDGQHRFKACRELGIPVQYEIEKGNTNEVMVELNSTQKSWSLTDYIDHYASLGRPWFVYYNVFKEKYNLSQTATIAILTSNQGRAGALIKNGKGMDKIDGADYIATIVNEFAETLDFAYTRDFIRALIRVRNKSNTQNIDKLLEKSLLIKKQVSTKDYLVIFTNMINRGRKKEKHISL